MEISREQELQIIIAQVVYRLQKCSIQAGRGIWCVIYMHFDCSSFLQGWAWWASLGWISSLEAIHFWSRCTHMSYKSLMYPMSVNYWRDKETGRRAWNKLIRETPGSGSGWGTKGLGESATYSILQVWASRVGFGWISSVKAFLLFDRAVATFMIDTWGELL